jgi:asparagine synthase (glutamine-hydrolysing)
MNHFTGTFDNNKPFSPWPEKISRGLTCHGSLVCSPELGYARIKGKQLFFAGDIYNIEGNVNDKATKLLTAFNTEGSRSFKKYDGEFTLIIISGDTTLIFRDRHGAGPQVYYNNKYYSSSLKNFLAIEEFRVVPNTEALFTFLSTGYIPSPMSSLREIQKLPAGEILKVKNGKPRREQLFTWKDFYHDAFRQVEISEQKATEKYMELHKKAIEKRIKGKKHVGLLLSGGYDSAGNIAVLREIYKGYISTYSIGFKDNPWTELPLTKLLAEKYNTNHHAGQIDGQEIKELPAIVASLGDPFQEGGMMVNYAAMKLAGKDKPDIILGGDGNDQHFGTAGKELALHYLLKKKGLMPAQKIFANLGKQPVFNKDNLLFRIGFHNEKILNILDGDIFGFKPHLLEKMSKNKYYTSLPEYHGERPDSFVNFDHLFMVHNFFSDIKQVINEIILFKASETAGMYDNKLSFPYMSTEIYDFLKSVPREFKVKGSLNDLARGRGISKFLHKNYLHPILPAEITQRKKQGGFAPLAIFFRDDQQRKKLRNFIITGGAVKELFSEKAIDNFFNSYEKAIRSADYWFWYKQVKAFQYFNLLVLAVWWEIFINRKEPEEIKDHF